MLESKELATHRHVIGVTGQGKSKLLASMFVQLLNQGVACALVDPHADLCHDVVSLLLDQDSLPVLTRHSGSRSSILPGPIDISPSTRLRRCGGRTACHSRLLRSASVSGRHSPMGRRRLSRTPCWPPCSCSRNMASH